MNRAFILLCQRIEMYVQKKKDWNFSLLKRICRVITLLKCPLSAICYHCSFSTSEEKHVAIYPSKIYDQSFFNQVLL